jgi:hypothetical protein
LYDHTTEPDIPGINSVEDGILLRKDLHASFAYGYTAFLKVCEGGINSDIF